MCRAILKILVLAAFTVLILLLAATLSYRVYCIWFCEGCCVCGDRYGTSEYRYGVKGHNVRIYCPEHTAPDSITVYPGEFEDFFHPIELLSPLLAIVVMYFFLKKKRSEEELIIWLGAIVGIDIWLLLVLHFEVYISLFNIMAISSLPALGFSLGSIILYGLITRRRENRGEQG